MTQTKSVDQLLEEMGVSQEDYERQCKLEMDGFQLGKQKYMDQYFKTKNDPNKDNTLLKPEAGLLQTYWQAVQKVITATVLRSRGGSARTQQLRKDITPLGSDRLAYLALRFALNIQEASLVDSCVKMGTQVKHDLEYYWFQNLAPGYLHKVEANLKTAHTAHRHNVLRHAARKVEIVDEGGIKRVKGIPSADWSPDDKFSVGKALLEAVTEATPLIRVSDRNKRVNVSSQAYGFINTRILYLEQTPACKELLESLHLKASELSPIAFPAVIPPKPWVDVRGGGFWTAYKGLGPISKLIRSYNRSCMVNARKQGVERVCSIINMIQATPYRINGRVLEVMDEAAKIGIADLPSPEQVRVEVDGVYPLEEDCPWDGDEYKRRKEAGDPELVLWNRRRSKAYDIWYREQSKRSSLIWKLRIAKKFMGEKAIYFFWNLDYRGRLYCIQPYINPQQDDSGKALLQFANGKRLGKSGARWLMIHGANEFGFDKAPLDDRVSWVREHHAQIMDSADNPLDGDRFWCEAENPFQFLAFAFEYAGYVREGEDFVSHLPVQVDGTCSGLQHYSALLRDAVGGRAVNLVPQKTKADVYAEVAEVVNQLLNQEGGEARKFAKAWLDRGVDRKTVKRNVMTFCYGATRPGFCQQLIDDIDDKPEGVDDYKACHYLGAINWQAVEVTLVKSVEAMGFLQKLAYFMAKNGMDIQWVTPVGLRVTQDYLKTECNRIHTWWGGARMRISVAHTLEDKNTVGSRNGIAPNFIHSLDASHLMLTTERCWDKGIRSFSYIHDSFGTHAADMELMNQTLRETFVEMYSEDLLGKFVADVRERVPAELRPEFDQIVAENKPSMGSLDLSLVEESPYFFS
jgi:DNA-directed RNA polymerase